jgi:hypothetical protein
VNHGGFAGAVGRHQFVSLWRAFGEIGPLAVKQDQGSGDQIRQCSGRSERSDRSAMHPSAPHGGTIKDYVALVETYHHLIMILDALPKTKGPEKLVPVVVALKPIGCTGHIQLE